MYEVDLRKTGLALKDRTKLEWGAMQGNELRLAKVKCMAREEQKFMSGTNDRMMNKVRTRMHQAVCGVSGSLSRAEPKTNHFKLTFVDGGVTGLEHTEGPMNMYKLFQGVPMLVLMEA